MTKDDIKRLAQTAGIPGNVTFMYPSEMRKFAILVAAEEREACAKECDEEAAFALRCGDGDRSGMYEWQADGAEKCAAAIRARSER